MTDELQYRVTANANLREEPSTEARVKTQLSPGTIVDVYATDGDWLFGAISGWVHRSVVEAVKPL